MEWTNQLLDDLDQLVTDSEEFMETIAVLSRFNYTELADAFVDIQRFIMNSDVGPEELAQE